jgi:hypothetical protein
MAEYPSPPEYPHGWFDPKELASQIVDIITLCPEIRLCYIGIGSKCFELLESREIGNGGNSAGNGGGSSSSGATTPITPTLPNAVGGVANGVVANGGGGNMEDAADLSEELEWDSDDDDEPDAENGGGDADGEAEDGFSGGEDHDHTPSTDASEHSETQSDGEPDAAIEAEVGAEGGEEQDGEEEEEDEEEGDGEAEDEEDDGFVEPGSGGVKLKLREILFYDDKVAIFRARHGRL